MKLGFIRQGKSPYTGKKIGFPAQHCYIKKDIDTDTDFSLLRERGTGSVEWESY